MLTKGVALVALLSMVVACADAQARRDDSDARQFPAAVVTPEHMARAAEVERQLAAAGGSLPTGDQHWFEVLTGTTPVLITAPHATKPTRDGRLRFADLGTGSLAVLLHELTGATVIYTTRASPSDPNYYDDNDFKRQVADTIARSRPILALDLHASDADRPYEVDLGTLHGRSLHQHESYLRDLTLSLRQAGVEGLTQDTFSADTNHTVTRWVSQRGVPCMQLEISATNLKPDGDDLHRHRYARLLQALVVFVRKVGAAPVSGAARPSGGSRRVHAESRVMDQLLALRRRDPPQAGSSSGFLKTAAPTEPADDAPERCVLYGEARRGHEPSRRSAACGRTTASTGRSWRRDVRQPSPNGGPDA